MKNRFIQFQHLELADVEVMKPQTAARIDPPIEVAMKELVDKYRPVRQRTMRSETTKDKAGALPPAVYYSQPPHSKVMFHDDSTVEGREGMEQIMPQVTDDDGDSHVPSITFVDDSTVEIVAVSEVPDQEDEYDTDSGSDMDDDVSRLLHRHNNTHQVWSRHSCSFSP